MNYSETLSTLRFADNVKRIETKAVRNVDPQAELIALMKDEIDALKKKLSEAGLSTEVELSAAAAAGAAASPEKDNGADGGAGSSSDVDPAAMALALQRAQENMERQIALQDEQRQKKMDEVRQGMERGCVAGVASGLYFFTRSLTATPNSTNPDPDSDGGGLDSLNEASREGAHCQRNRPLQPHGPASHPAVPH